MDTTAFLAAVDRAITVPNYQPRFSQSDILAFSATHYLSLLATMAFVSRNAPLAEHCGKFNTEIKLAARLFMTCHVSALKTATGLRILEVVRLTDS